MTEPRRRGPKPSVEKRDAIIRSALEQFARRGVDASTTREIAEGAGTTERTLFKHFRSKAVLVQAAIEDVSFAFMDARRFGRVHEERPFTRDEFSRWHRDFLRDRVAIALAAPDNYRILFSELLRDQDFRKRYGQRWMDGVFLPMVAQFEKMQKASEIGLAQTPVALAGAFFSLNLGFLVSRFALAPEMGWDNEGSIESVASMFLAIATSTAHPAP
jgi:AcrR family transcriptional regulator